MQIVLTEADNHTLHASVLADIIFERKLYTKKNGEKAQYNQIRARCGHYPDLFEALPGNYIKLKTTN
jgi:antitoxin Phd